jgi:hypothetical protein
MTTIMSGNFFNTNCDVDCSTAHILSYLIAGLTDLGSQFHYCLQLFQKNLFLKESPKKVVAQVQIRGPVPSTRETIRKLVRDDMQVESVMRKVQNNIRCVRPGSILNEPLSL